MTHDCEMKFHAGEQEMAHDLDMNCKVHSAKHEMTQHREINFHSGEHSVEQCSLPRWRGLCGDYVRPMEGVYEIYLMSI